MMPSSKRDHCGRQEERRLLRHGHQPVSATIPWVHRAILGSCFQWTRTNTHAGRVQYRQLRGGQAGRSTWRELGQLSLQLGHLVIGGILACMDGRKANKDWPVWFDPWVCLASSGSVCVNHFIYAWIGIADVGAWIRPIPRHGHREQVFGRGIEPGKGGSLCIRLLVHNVLKEAPLAHEARALLLFG